MVKDLLKSISMGGTADWPLWWAGPAKSHFAEFQSPYSTKFTLSEFFSFRNHVFLLKLFFVKRLVISEMEANSRKCRFISRIIMQVQLFILIAGTYSHKDYCIWKETQLRLNAIIANFKALLTK